MDATLESIDGAVTVTGTVQVPWSAECRRCLDPVEGVVTVELREVFEVRPIDGETYPIEGDEVDLEPVVRDAALLNLPLTVLCRPDCPGPSPRPSPCSSRARPPRRPPRSALGGPRRPPPRPRLTLAPFDGPGTPRYDLPAALQGLAQRHPRSRR